MTARRAAVLAVLLVASRATAQPVALAETPRPGDACRYTLDLKLTGQLVLTENGTKQAVPLSATARHRFADKTLAVADGLPARSTRFYDEANASATVGGEKSDRALPADRKLVVARRTPDGVFAVAPAGPLTRDELDLVAEHFDPHCLPGLLPGKMVTVGDTWGVPDVAAHTAGLLDKLTRHTLQGKLVSVGNGTAAFAISGTIEGVESGAKVSLVVDATGSFDVSAGRVTALTWKQTDDRAAGPVTPAAKVEATITLRREFNGGVPAELGAELPAEVPAGATNLRQPCPSGRYEVLHPRDWHVTGATDTHLVLRLLDGGEFVAQATLTPWAKAAAGQHAAADDFKKAAAAASGWVPARVVADGEVPAAEGYWVYRLSAEGKAQEVPVLRAVYLVAGPTGDQMVVTVVAPADRARLLNGRDAALAGGVRFGR
ncbi:hypothetical protein [Urbifossiella limnaea]|uniref:DUF4412 domain-containing protein n=1 Tax=Urbifossiella limnaea TaxID=2528023 RepID=A0A517XPX8_9BACT|nr:hypothetical protein [Urbifossiella limnaea]QDU19546.1 hypothetical protein ETAA1_14750 [Urbifossiella limnaea]